MSNPNLSTYSRVLWCHPSGAATGSPDADNSGIVDPSPSSESDYYSFTGALSEAVSGDAILFKDGDYSGLNFTFKDNVDFIGNTVKGAILTLAPNTSWKPSGSFDVYKLQLKTNEVNNAVAWDAQTDGDVVNLFNCLAYMLSDRGAGWQNFRSLSSHDHTVNFFGSDIFDISNATNQTGVQGAGTDVNYYNCTRYINMASTGVILGNGNSIWQYSTVVNVSPNNTVATTQVSGDKSTSFVQGFTDRNDGDPLFIDLPNLNLNFLPRSPAIFDGGQDSIPADAIWVTDTGSGDGSQGSPYNYINQKTSVLADASLTSSKTIVFVDGLNIRLSTEALNDDYILMPESIKGTTLRIAGNQFVGTAPMDAATNPQSIIIKNFNITAEQKMCSPNSNYTFTFVSCDIDNQGASMQDREAVVNTIGCRQTYLNTSARMFYRGCDGFDIGMSMKYLSGAGFIYFSQTTPAVRSINNCSFGLDGATIAFSVSGTLTGSNNVGVGFLSYPAFIDNQDVDVIDSENGNLDLLPSSQSIQSGAADSIYKPTDTTKIIEGSTFNVKWADFNNTGGSNAGTYADPWESEQDILDNISSSDVVVFKEGTHLCSRGNGLQLDTGNTGNAENNYFLDSEYAGERKAVLQSSSPGANFRAEVRFGGVTLTHGIRNLAILDGYRSNGPSIIGTNPGFIMDGCLIKPWRLYNGEVMSTTTASVVKNTTFADRDDSTATGRLVALYCIVQSCNIYNAATRTSTCFNSNTVASDLALYNENLATPVAAAGGDYERCYYNQGSSPVDFILANPLFIDPKNGNFNILPASPALA